MKIQFTEGVALSRVTNFEDALIVMRIRNACREYMTRDTREISETMQRHWWDGLDPDETEAFLLFDHEEPVGYGLIVGSTSPWISGGLLPEARGRGLGKTLFSSLIERIKHRDGDLVRLEVLNSNLHARHIYLQLGFREISTDARISTLELRVK